MGVEGTCLDFLVDGREMPSAVLKEQDGVLPPGVEGTCLVFGRGMPLPLGSATLGSVTGTGTGTCLVDGLVNGRGMPLGSVTEKC